MGSGGGVGSGEVWVVEEVWVTSGNVASLKCTEVWFDHNIQTL